MSDVEVVDEVVVDTQVRLLRAGVAFVVFGAGGGSTNTWAIDRRDWEAAGEPTKATLRVLFPTTSRYLRVSNDVGTGVIDVIVHGHKYELTASPGARAEVLQAAALRKHQITQGRVFDNRLAITEVWELRDADGRLVDPKEKVAGIKLPAYLNPPAGVGG